MRSIKNYVQAVKARREENADDKGFSLIELIVVVVILGILAAIAVPVFMGLQGQAEESARESVAANAATQAAAQLAVDPTDIPTSADFANLANTEGTGASAVSKYSFSVAPTTGLEIGNFCITVTEGTKGSAESGPGC